MVSGIHIASLWNQKATLWINGRKNWRKRIDAIPPKQQARIWFHVSSLGEFEQARPVISLLQSRQPSTEIILTFFSPSGYEVRKNYPHATVLYLPPDLPGNAERWVNTINPDLAVFVKYDAWPGYLAALHKAHIPFTLISAHFVPEKIFQSWRLPPARSLLKKCRMIFLQNGTHLERLRSLGFTQTRVSGDTRVDRVIELPAEAGKFFENKSLQNKYNLVAGSIWPEDENVLLPLILDGSLSAILAPHDVSASNLQRLLKKTDQKGVLLSSWDWQAAEAPPQILIVDSIGVLALLYAVGEIAYIGGGFGHGIHNILEPMAHGKPVVFGPKHTGFPEAVAMVKSKGGFVVKDKMEMEAVVEYLQGDALQHAQHSVQDYIRQNAGASHQVAEYLMDSLPCRPE